LDSLQRRRRSGTIDQEKGSVDDFVWAPDAKSIVLVVHDPDPREPQAKEKEKKTVPPIVIDRFQFKEDIGGYITNRWSHLKLLDLASRRLNALRVANTTTFCRPGRPMERRSPLSPNAASTPVARKTGTFT
jgi:hypothetical protein